MTASGRTVRFRVIGMDCASDAAEIEAAARGIAGVEEVRVSAATHLLTLTLQQPQRSLSAVEAAVTSLGYRLTPFSETAAAQGVDRPAASLEPGYARALWIVVLLNLGFGAIEIVGGVLARSQALKADALDFLGDGSITLLGLLAIRWTLDGRARSALLQGYFLALLGVGVLTTTVYRIVVQQPPEAEVMGVLGLLALGVNVAAAAVLLPHRTGDANARAVWLFSRNDAIGNAAVVAAALLVAWTGTAWPDLAVALMIAGLFLHSATVIVRDARADLDQVASRAQVG